jgi:hypothetical protein
LCLHARMRSVCTYALLEQDTGEQKPCKLTCTGIDHNEALIVNMVSHVEKTLNLQFFLVFKPNSKHDVKIAGFHDDPFYLDIEPDEVTVVIGDSPDEVEVYLRISIEARDAQTEAVAPK